MGCWKESVVSQCSPHEMTYNVASKCFITRDRTFISPWAAELCLPHCAPCKLDPRQLLGAENQPQPPPPSLGPHRNGELGSPTRRTGTLPCCAPGPPPHTCRLGAFHSPGMPCIRVLRVLSQQERRFPVPISPKRAEMLLSCQKAHSLVHCTHPRSTSLTPSPRSHIPAWPEKLHAPDSSSDPVWDGAPWCCPMAAPDARSEKTSQELRSRGAGTGQGQRDEAQLAVEAQLPVVCSTDLAKHSP